MKSLIEVRKLNDQVDIELKLNKNQRGEMAST